MKITKKSYYSDLKSIPTTLFVDKRLSVVNTPQGGAQYHVPSVAA